MGNGPAARTFDVEELVKRAWEAEIRVPHFQRDFRWTWEDVRRLFDSIVKGYPVGSLLLWSRPAPAQSLVLGELKLEAPASADSLWVVDGQQRLTSLANALHPDSARSRTFALAYDLVKEEFVRRPAVEHPLIIPLPVLFDLKEILAWFARYPATPDRFDLATGLTRRIRQFVVPAYLVKDPDPRVLQDIFDRMNNFGKRLTRAEVFSALNAGEEGSELERYAFDEMAARIDEQTNFGLIDDNTVLAGVLARRGTEVRRDIRREFEGHSEQEAMAAYQAGEDALRLAVQFLQRDAQVPHVSMLAYRYLLVVLSRVFAFHPDPSPRHRQLLRRWYWRAATAGPEQFKGGTPNAARVLLTRVHEDDLSRSLSELLQAVEQNQLRLPSLEKFNPKSAATKIALCAWWSRGPRNPLTGEPVSQHQLASDIAERRTARDAVVYLMPQGQIPEELRPSAANRALIPGLEVDAAEVPAYFIQQPLDFSTSTWDAVLASHSIPDSAAQALAKGHGQQFAIARLQSLQANLEDFLYRMTELAFEDTPPLRELVLEDEETDDSD